MAGDGVVLENVRGAPVDRWSEDLLSLGYHDVEVNELDAADYGLAQHRRRVFIVAGPRLIQWPAPTHGEGREPWEALGPSLGLPRPAEGDACAMRWWSAPSPTVTTTEVKGTRGTNAIGGVTSSGRRRGGPDRASDATWLAASVRRVSLEQAARLQGFPVDYPFQGTVEDRYRQIGNAVPPMMAFLLGKAVLQAEAQ